MPVHKVSGGYKWGSKGHVYPTKAGAHKQEAATYANGYTGKSLDPLDRVIGLTAIIAKAGKRHYLAEGEKPPAGVQVKEGTRGGKYIEVEGGGGGQEEQEEQQPGQGGPFKKGDMVLYMEPTLHGPKQRLGKVDAVGPDGKVEVRDHNGGIHKIDPKELKPHEPKQQELDEQGFPKPAVRPEFQGVADELGGAELDERDQGLDKQGLQARADELQAMLKHYQEHKAPLADVMRAGDRLRRIQDKLGELGGEKGGTEPFAKTPEFSDPQKAVDLYQRRENLLQRQLAGAERDGDTKLARELQGDLKDVQGKRAAAEAKAGGGDQAKLGPQAQEAIGEFDQLQAKLKAGELENPQELVDAARRLASAYEGDRQQLGQGDQQHRALQGSLDEATKKHDQAKELYDSWKQRYEYARNKGAPAEEVKAARERLDAAEDEFHDTRMGLHSAEKALHQYARDGQQQPAAAPAAPAKPGWGMKGTATRRREAGAHVAPAAPAAPAGGGAVTQEWQRKRDAANANRVARAASADAKVPKVPEGPKKVRIGRIPGQWGGFGEAGVAIEPGKLIVGEWNAEKAAWQAGKNWVIRGPGGYQVADKMPAQGGDFMRIRPDGIVEHYRGKVKGVKAPKAGKPGGSTPAAFGPAGQHHAVKEIAKLGKEPGAGELRELYNRAKGGEFLRELQGQHPDWTKQQLTRYWRAYYKAVDDAYREAWRRQHAAGV